MFQEGLLHGIHFVSHAQEILSEQFSYHEHGHGHQHIHHHDFLDKVKIVFEHDNQKNHGENENIPLQDQQSKSHFPVYYKDELHTDGIIKSTFSPAMTMSKSSWLEVLTPPPKS